MQKLLTARLGTVCALALALSAGACASSTITGVPNDAALDLPGKDFVYNTDVVGPDAPVPPDRVIGEDGGPPTDIPGGEDGFPPGDGTTVVDIPGSDIPEDRRTGDINVADMPGQACTPLQTSSCPSNRTCINDTGSATTGTCSAFGTRTALDDCDFGFSNGDCGRNLVCLQDSGANPPPPQCFAYCDPDATQDPCSQDTLCVGTLVDVDDTQLRFCAEITNCDFFAPPAACNRGRPCCPGGMRCEPLSIDDDNFIKAECLPAATGAGVGDRNDACGEAADPNSPDPSRCQAGFLCISFGSQTVCSTDAQCTTPEKCIGGNCSRPPSCQPICDPTTGNRVSCSVGTCSSSPGFFGGAIGVCL